MKSAIITDIQRSSTHDGPGLRTTVFFKGCPLKCAWCHNPESISFEPQILNYPEKCIGCGMCDKGCFAGAKVVCGKHMTSDEVLFEVMQDIDYYKKDGGVTFSGGEPFAQKEFLNEITDKCIQKGINTAVETSFIYYDEQILKKMQVIMADFKIWDDDLHKKYTGVSNKTIKENFIKANSLGIPIIARTPVIPGIDQDIKSISEFLYGLKNVIQYELLPYHPLGTSKRMALNLPPDGFSVPQKSFMKEFDKYVFIR